MWAAAMGDVPMLVAFLKSESKFPSLLDAVRWPIIMLQFCFHCIKNHCLLSISPTIVQMV